MVLVGVAALVGLLGGFYPALVLSRFRPASTLRTSVAGQSGSGLLRSLLVVLQFAVSIGLGIAAVVVFAQISYRPARSISASTRTGSWWSSQRASRPPPFKVWSARSTPTRLSKVRPLRRHTVFRFELRRRDRSAWRAREPLTVSVGPDGTGLSFLIPYSASERPRSFGVAWPRCLAPRIRPTANILINRAAGRTVWLFAAKRPGQELLRHKCPRESQKGPAHHRGRDRRLHVRRRPHAGSFPPTMPIDRTTPGCISVRVPAGRRSPSAFRHRPHLACLRAFHCHQPPFSGRGFREAISRRRAAGHDLRPVRGHRYLHRLPGLVRAGGLLDRATHQGDRVAQDLRRADPGHHPASAVAVLHSGASRQSNRLAGGLLLSARWLEGYANRISFNPLYFIGAGAALVIAWTTVIVHAAQVASANPIHALRYE